MHNAYELAAAHNVCILRVTTYHKTNTTAHHLFTDSNFRRLHKFAEYDAASQNAVPICSNQLGHITEEFYTSGVPFDYMAPMQPLRLALTMDATVYPTQLRLQGF